MAISVNGIWEQLSDSFGGFWMSLIGVGKDSLTVLLQYNKAELTETGLQISVDFVACGVM